MTDAQLYLAIGVPLIGNALMITVLVLYLNAKLDVLREAVNGINGRLDDLRDLWRAELRRVEEVLDARLKHLEER
jgi:hypothetical protein